MEEQKEEKTKVVIDKQKMIEAMQRDLLKKYEADLK